MDYIDFLSTFRTKNSDEMSESEKEQFDAVFDYNKNTSRYKIALIEKEIESIYYFLGTHRGFVDFKKFIDTQNLVFRHIQKDWKKL